ncbi:hypothetical protein AVDCRST_MAG94-3215 [uncultured Leptolyngbya sp.]|uniref:Uncharacterized protein n=1 Tax=uncultured Leptolyngbya sp. TaxID=332963 RepID=A0A6J4MG27_9CYAN|nr:hypothetical protein AVDCRST_MAG94-3215 [uncultured Leptolyngbya sp.]
MKSWAGGAAKLGTAPRPRQFRAPQAPKIQPGRVIPG